MLDDPMRSEARSLAAGCVLAMVAVIACAVVAIVRPRDSLGDAPIVMVRETGALYVRVGETLHPALNLASARLVAGNAGQPQRIAAIELRRSKRGPLIGIPGAPTEIGEPLAAGESHWAVCDDGAATTVITGPPANGAGMQPLSGATTMLVRSPPQTGDTYLLYDGKRARVNLGDLPTMRALRLDGVVPTELAAAVLNAIPEAAPIAAPVIPGAGRDGPPSLDGLRVGTVVRIHRAGGDDHYVVLSSGAQRIGQVAADLIRFTDSQGSRDIVTVTADAVSATPAVDELPVGGFPHDVNQPVDRAVVCSGWAAGAGAPTTFTGDSLPLPADAAVNGVYVPAGRSLFAAASGLFLITDTGVRFRVPDAATAGLLGVSTPAVAAPWPILQLLTEGPELSRRAALVTHNAIVGSPPG